MAHTYVGQKRIRRYFGKIREVLEMPNLIEVQKSSYDLFLRSGEAEKPTDGNGIQGTFQSVFPIKDFNETAVLEFVKYELEKPKYDVDECQARDMTYAAPLKVTLRLIVFDVDETTGARSVKDIKEQDVYMGDMPLMTGNGTFIVNGTERVIVSQMHRSPGVCFSTMTRVKPIRRASCCSPAGSFPIAARGWILNLTPKTSCLRASTAAVNCRSPRCFMRWAWIRKASWMPITRP